VTAQADTVRRPALRPSQRRARDLHWLRVGLALVIAPLGPIVLVTFFATAIAGVFALIVAAALGIAAATWSLVFGLIYLNTVTRMRGIIGRSECILLGVCTAFLLPGATLLAAFVWDGIEHAFLFGPWTRWDSAPSTLLTLGLAFSPFGALGGWIFWRTGIRPAAAPTTDFAAVFD
jgi:hypothetical protein